MVEDKAGNGDLAELLDGADAKDFQRLVDALAVLSFREEMMSDTIGEAASDILPDFAAMVLEEATYRGIESFSGECSAGTMDFDPYEEHDLDDGSMELKAGGLLRDTEPGKTQ